jgi:hypothetical protein
MADDGTVGQSGEAIYRMVYNSADNSTNVASTPTGWMWNQSWEVNTPHVEIDGKLKKSSQGINPRLYFKYVKSKLQVVENMYFKRRMKQLEALADKYAKLGQEALSEECIRQFYIASRESAMWACGFKVFVTKEVLDKFRFKCTVDLKITPIKNFARIIPAKAAAKIKKAMDRKLFDDYVIVHLDNREKTAVKETQKEKIEREKDPICFGRITESDKYYFVSDWIDEMDELRLEDIIKKMSLKKKDMEISKDIKFEVKEAKVAKDKPE